MASSSITEHDFTSKDGDKFFYLSAGPPSGPLLIFIHGWPALAETWKPQLLAFADLGFRTVAPDTRGYGRSVVSKDRADYALERHVADMLALLAHLDRDQAVWIGHDWGAGLVWSFAAHHPEACAGVVNMCVPYRTIEFGLEALVATVNRERYPVDKYPNGQWCVYPNLSDQQTRVSLLRCAFPGILILIVDISLASPICPRIKNKSFLGYHGLSLFPSPALYTYLSFLP